MTREAEREAATAQQETPVPPEGILAQLLLGVPIVRMIHTGVALNLYGILGDRVMAASAIAEACGTLEEPTYRFLRGLATVGVLCEHEGRAFSLSPAGQLLRPNVVGSFEALAHLHGASWYSDSYRDVVHSLRTGQSAFTKYHGKPLFAWLAEHPDESAAFGRAMSTFSRSEVGPVLSSFDFSSARHIVDVGGGHGWLLWKILEAASGARGTLFDTADTLRQGEGVLPEVAQQRCRRVAGDFFESVPAGGDLYILKHILHDWDDDKALRILSNVSAAMPAGAELLVMEQGVAPPGVPSPGKILDVMMLVLLDGGRERTAQAHASLMAKAGLEFQREISTPGPITLFLARKP